MILAVKDLPRDIVPQFIQRTEDRRKCPAVVDAKKLLRNFAIREHFQAAEMQIFYWRQDGQSQKREFLWHHLQILAVFQRLKKIGKESRRK